MIYNISETSALSYQLDFIMQDINESSYLINEGAIFDTIKKKIGELIEKVKKFFSAIKRMVIMKYQEFNAKISKKMLDMDKNKILKNAPEENKDEIIQLFNKNVEYTTIDDDKLQIALDKIGRTDEILDRISNAMYKSITNSLDNLIDKYEGKSNDIVISFDKFKEAKDNKFIKDLNITKTITDTYDFDKIYNYIFNQKSRISKLSSIETSITQDLTRYTMTVKKFADNGEPFDPEITKIITTLTNSKLNLVRNAISFIFVNDDKALNDINDIWNKITSLSKANA